MPNVRQPRSGSMQFWPRKRARREYPVVKGWPKAKEPKLLGFAGYKVGMTHVMAIESYKNSINKGENISVPVTVIECPPLRIAYIRFYKKDGTVLTQVFADNIDKSLGKKIRLPNKTSKKIDDIKPDSYADVTAVVYTQPKLTGIGKKKPEIFEIALGGKPEEKVNFLKENMGKEIPLTEIFKEGDLLD